MSNPKRVLLAEDNGQLRELYTELLTAAGFDVMAVADGLDAFEAFMVHGPFDAVVTDCNMPRLTGAQLVACLRDRKSDVPALLMSGRMMLDDADQKRLRVGPALRKPFALDSLVQAVLRLVTTPVG
jgi:CheY-like chemotaxis protein